MLFSNHHKNQSLHYYSSTNISADKIVRLVFPDGYGIQALKRDQRKNSTYYLVIGDGHVVPANAAYS